MSDRQSNVNGMVVTTALLVAVALVGLSANAAPSSNQQPSSQSSPVNGQQPPTTAGTATSAATPSASPTQSPSPTSKSTPMAANSPSIPNSVTKSCPTGQLVVGLNGTSTAYGGENVLLGPYTYNGPIFIVPFSIQNQTTAAISLYGFDVSAESAPYVSGTITVKSHSSYPRTLLSGQSYNGTLLYQNLYFQTDPRTQGAWLNGVQRWTIRQHSLTAMFSTGDSTCTVQTQVGIQTATGAPVTILNEDSYRQYRGY